MDVMQVLVVALIMFVPLGIMVLLLRGLQLPLVPMVVHLLLP